MLTITCSVKHVGIICVVLANYLEKYNIMKFTFVFTKWVIMAQLLNKEENKTKFRPC